MIKPFVPNAPFLYPLKTSENRQIFRCFQRVEKGCIENKWIKIKANINTFQSNPSKHFNVVSTFSFGWCDVATWDNVISTLKQRCVFQHWNLQRRINVAYFNVDMNNVRQRRNNVVIFNVEFYNVGKRRNNVVKMTASKKNKKHPEKFK